MVTKTPEQQMTRAPEVRRRSFPSQAVPGMDITRGRVFEMITSAPVASVGNEAPRASDQLNVDNAIAQLLQVA